MKATVAVLLVCGLFLGQLTDSANGSNVERRFANQQGDHDLLELCTRFHMLPVGSLSHTRALSVCQGLIDSIPEKMDPTVAKRKYNQVVQDAKGASIKAKAAQKPTPEQQANIDASTAAQTKNEEVRTAAAHNTEVRAGEAAAAEEAGRKDLADRDAQWQKQLEDRSAETQYENDLAAIDAAKRRDALDTQHVEDAKRKWAELESSLADAKAKAPSDPALLAKQEDVIKAAEDQRLADEAERLADETEAKRDKDLAASAEKAAREEERLARKEGRAYRAQERSQALVEARGIRDAALARQRLIARAESERAKLRAEQEGAETRLKANEAKRATEDIERKQRMDAYKKEEAAVQGRRQAFDDAERLRAARLAQRLHDDEVRAAAKAADDASVNKADEVPEQQRKMQKDEEECTSPEVGCGSGTCYQKIKNKKSKRCKCEKEDDDGKNCEHPACAYDETDSSGNKIAHKGNMVNGQCVRWFDDYECPKCGRPWQLVVTCRKKKGTKDIRTTDSDCKGLRKPENRFKYQVCKLCPRMCSFKRDLVSNTTLPVPQSRRLSPSPPATPANPGSATTCDEVELSCNDRMIRTVASYDRPEQLAPVPAPAPPAAGGAAPPATPATPALTASYIAVELDSMEKCEEDCLARDGVKGSSKDRLKLDATTHCTWVYWEGSPPNGKPTCYEFFTGAIPDLAPTPTKRRKGAAGTQVNDPSGFLSFVVYPRRWDLFREHSLAVVKTTHEFCDKGSTHGTPDYFVYEGHAKARTEGLNTFAVPTRAAVGSCVSSHNSVLENGQSYARRQGSKIRRRMVDIPSDWQRYDINAINRADAGILSKMLNGVEWTYSVDRSLRVTKVTGTPKKEDTVFRQNGGFENMFNGLTSRTYYSSTQVNAPFCAGHLVAYKMLPPNFYFNYVPQHANSNSGGGCWATTEGVALEFISNLKCHLSYHVEINYGRHGIDKPSTILANLPGWAKATSGDIPSRRLAKRTKAPGDKETKEAYVNDDLKCHYFYRPYTMSLDIEIKGSQPNSHCNNLASGVDDLGRPLVDIKRKTEIVTTRVYGYLINKETKVPTGVHDSTNMKRLLHFATTMKKSDTNSDHDTKLSCYAETGNIAMFTKLRMDYDFSGAFLGDQAHKKCLRVSDDLDCPKWNLTPEKDKSWGPLVLAEIATTERCIQIDGTGLKLADVPNGNYAPCARFDYKIQKDSFDLSELDPLPAPFTGVEDLVLGYVGFDLGSVPTCLTEDKTWTSNLNDCWVLRISYYNFPKQSNPTPTPTPTVRVRTLQEGDSDSDSDGDGGGDGDGDDDDTCSSEDVGECDMC